MGEVGFEPTRFTTPGLKSGSLDHSDTRPIIYYITISLSTFILPNKISYFFIIFSEYVFHKCNVNHEYVCS